MDRTVEILTDHLMLSSSYNGGAAGCTHPDCDWQVEYTKDPRNQRFGIPHWVFVSFAVHQAQLIQDS